MFDSGISVKNLVEELQNEVDIALDIPNATYITWLNSLQQLLYTEIIKEQKKAVISDISESPISISSIGEENTRFEDIYAVYANGKQLIKSTVTSGVIFPDTFYKDNNDLGFNTNPKPTELTVVYIVKPAMVKDGDKSTVAIPIEFIDLVKAKLRGEAYKLANEGDLSAMWLNDYNTLLETFKAWISEKAPIFGM